MSWFGNSNSSNSSNDDDVTVSKMVVSSNHDTVEEGEVVVGLILGEIGGDDSPQILSLEDLEPEGEIE